MASDTLLVASTEDCLKDFFQRFPVSAGRRLIVSFTHAATGTVEDWSANRCMPKGELLLRLRCLLDLVGYQVIEFYEIPQVTRQFARLIGFDLLTVGEAQMILGYKDPKSLYRVILRADDLMRERIYKMQRTVESNLAELEARKAEWQKRIEGFKAAPRSDIAPLSPHPDPTQAIDHELAGMHYTAVASGGRSEQNTAILPLADVLRAAYELFAMLDPRAHQANRQQLGELVGRDQLKILVTELDRYL